MLKIKDTSKDNLFFIFIFLPSVLFLKDFISKLYMCILCIVARDQCNQKLLKGLSLEDH